MSGYSDAQIAQLIADHAALKDEVAKLRVALKATLLLLELAERDHSRCATALDGGIGSDA